MLRNSMLGSLLALGLIAPAQAQDDAPPPSFSSVSEDGSTSTASSVASDPIAGRFYLAPMMSYGFADNSRNTDDGYGGTLSLGKKFGATLAIEATGFYHRYSDNVPGGDETMESFGGGLAALLSPLPALRQLYAIGSVQYGVTKELPNAADDEYDSLLYSAGLGYLFPIADNGTSLRIEALYRYDDFDRDDANGAKRFEDTVVNLGVLIPLGAAPQPEVSAVNTQAEVVPLIAPADGDEDGDGVADSLDRCPGTPAGTAVDADGCPLPKPACQKPEPGQAITLEGCSAGDTIVLQGVTFDFNQARLTPNAKVILDGVADALIAKADIKVEVGGHTDAKGTDDYNVKLSQRRAESVVQYLVGRGVDTARMSSQGYGETMPVADNETDEGRELNRRVELKIVP